MEESATIGMLPNEKPADDGWSRKHDLVYRSTAFNRQATTDALK